MYRLFEVVRAVKRALKPYTAVVYWEGEMFVHRAWTRRDADAWLECYPCAAQGEVYTRRGMLVASRRSVSAGEHVERANEAMCTRLSMWDVR